MTFAPQLIELNPQLRALDPLLFDRFAELNREADEFEKHCLDQKLTVENWQALLSQNKLKKDEAEFLVGQWNDLLTGWNSLAVSEKSAYAKGMALAHQGDMAGARRAFSDVKEGSLQHKKIFQEKLVWLDIYFGQWGELPKDLALLKGLEEANPYVDFGNGFLAYRAKKFEEAKKRMDAVQKRKNSPAILKAESEYTEKQIYSSQPSLPRDPIPSLTKDKKNYVAGHIDHIHFKVLQDQKNIEAPLTCINLTDFDAIKGRIVALTRSNDLQLEDVPWFMHVFMNTHLAYQFAEEDRDVRQCFKEGYYDCTEYVEALRIVLDEIGVENYRVTLHANTDNEVEHAFLAFKINGKWGFGSSSSFQDPKKSSLEDLVHLWDWAKTKGKYDIEKFTRGAWRHIRFI